MDERTALKYIGLSEWLSICRRILDGEKITYKYHDGPPRPDENYLAATHFAPFRAVEPWVDAREITTERNKLRAERRKKRASAAARRRELGPQIQPDHSARNREIYAARLAGGATLQQIGEKFGITGARVRAICARQQEIEARRLRRLYPRAHLAQSIDPGGPRDVWLTFVPGGDPRDP